MRLTALIVCAFVLACVASGCERTETAIDLYKNAKQKTEQAHEQSKQNIEKKAKEAFDTKTKDIDKEGENSKDNN